MISMRTVLVGFALAAALGGAAQAQGDQPGQQVSNFQLMTGTVLVITPDGTVSRRSDVPPNMLDELMKEARPMPAGGIMFMHDNKLYATPDRRMEGGKTLSEAIARSRKP